MADQIPPLNRRTPIKWTEKQWTAACDAMTQLKRPRRYNGMRYVTAHDVAVLSAVSVGVARVALRKLADAGVLRRSPSSGSRPEIYRVRTF